MRLSQEANRDPVFLIKVKYVGLKLQSVSLARATASTSLLLYITASLIFAACVYLDGYNVAFGTVPELY